MKGSNIMNDDTLKLMRNDYKKKIDKLNKYLNMLDEIKKLKEEEHVKRYLELVDNISKYAHMKNMTARSDADILDQIINTYVKNTDLSEGIYVSCGKFVRLGIGDSLSTDDNYDYKLYVDIEKNMDAAFQIEKKDVSEFEKTNVILDLGMPFSVENYNKFRRNFYKLAMNHDMEYAYTKTMDKYEIM